MNTAREKHGVEIINTGGELMLGYVLNTHQQWLCRQLSERGHVVVRQVAVDDSAPAIREAVSAALLRARLIVVTGGLGPTSDDRTRQLIAELLGRSLHEDPAILAHIDSFFGRRNRHMPESTRVQALVPSGALALQNAHGTAPGLVMEHEGSLLIMLPGPPRELRPMFLNQVIPILEERLGTPPDFACTVLKTTGIGESFLEEKIAKELVPFMERGLDVGYCARVGEVDLRFVARGPGAAALVQDAEKLARRHLKGFIYGKDPDQLDGVVVQLLTKHRKTLALAESCTGGFIANRITNIPGASAVFLAGLVTYANSAKEAFLGVSEETLLTRGAVSEETAREMAEGARSKTGADYALSVTGIAGPDGGTEQKPVGTVFIGLATPTPGRTEVKRMLNQYDRETFKFLTSQQALEMLRKELIALAV